MSRVWFLGSKDTPPTATTLIAPTKAIVGFTGNRQPAPSPGAGYPLELTDDEWCEILFRIFQYQTSISYSFTGTLSGDSYIYAGTGTGILSHIDITVDDERDLLIKQPAQGGWSASVMFHQTVTKNGTIIAESDVPMPVFLFIGIDTDFNGAPVDAYVYGTTSLKWLPSFLFTLSGGFPNITASSLGEPPASVGNHVLSTTGLYRGTTFAVRISILDFLSISSFNVTIDPTLWWEYRNSQGADPIWNAATGAQLRNPVTQQF